MGEAGALRIGMTYLFSGFCGRTEDGKLKLEPKCLEPVRAAALVTTATKRDAKVGDLQTWMTDDKGLLYPVGRTGAVHYYGTTRCFHLLPPDVLLRAWAADRQKWHEKLAQLIAKKESRGVELSERQLKKSHLRPPDRTSEEEAEKTYARWYDSLTESTVLSAFVLPKVRAVMLTFSGPSMEGAQIVLTPPRGEALEAVQARKNDEGSVTAVISNSPERLPPGLYSIRVHLPNNTPHVWNAPVRKTSHYELKESIRFHITNFAGEFDVVSCDPISVEEAVMLQFAPLYSHLAVAAKQRAIYPEASTDPDFREVKEIKLPEALKDWSERLGWMHAKSKFAVGLINADGYKKQGKMLGKAIWKSIKPEDELLKASKESIDLAFNGLSTISDWKDFVADMKAEAALQDVKKLIWKDLDGTFARHRWWKYLKEQYVDEEAILIDLKGLAEADRKLILRAGIPTKQTRLQKLVGERAGKAIDKTLTVGAQALDVYNLALAFDDLLEARNELEDLQGDLRPLLEQLDSVLGRAACREAIGTLERLRAATVAADLKLDEEEARAAMAALDLVLGTVSTFVPQVQVIVLLKATAELAAEAGANITSWLDRIALKGFFQDGYARRFKQMSHQARASGSNQGLMSSRRGGDLEVQLRLRAEALTGLIGLLTRASVASKDEADYLARVRKYRVAEYIEEVLLGDRWQFPIKPLVPISMDAFWLFATSEWGELASRESLAQQLGYTKPLTLAAMNAFPGGMAMLSVADAVLTDHVVADFHGTFPIHRMDAGEVEALARAFRTAWKNVGRQAIDYTCVYTRPRDSKDDKDWKPLNAGGTTEVENLGLVSPLDQVRVLLILKENVEEACYPVSFQLRRTDGLLSIDGPVYRDVIRKLDKELLESEPYKGRMGCVFYPFFQIGAKVVPGIKPLAGAGVDLAGVGLYQLLHYLDDMRYEIRVRLGDESSGIALELGGPGGARCKLSTFRLGITDKPDERKLLVASFLRSRSEACQYPPLAVTDRGAGPLYARVGGTEKYRLATPEESAALRFDGFDWKQPVELVLVAWCHGITTNDYEKLGLDWTRIPVTFDLVNYTGSDTQGPSYSAVLNHVGRLSTAGAALAKGPVPPDRPIAEWLQQMQSGPGEMQKLVNALHVRNFGSMEEAHDTYDLFVAHVRLDYYTPAGEHVDCLRPFGHMESTADFRIGVRHVRSAEASGIVADTLLAPVSGSWKEASGYLRPEYELHFPPPKSYTSDVPWERSGDVARIKKWIEDESRKRDPRLELVKGA